MKVQGSPRQGRVDVLSLAIRVELSVHDAGSRIPYMRIADRRIIREYYVGPGHRLLPEVVHVGWTDLTRARPAPLGRHRHDGAFEICYVLRGHVDWWAGNRVYEVPHGYLYVTQPGEWHGGVDSMLHPCELFWIALKFPERGAWPGLSAPESRDLHGRLGGIRERVFPAAAQITSLFWSVLVEHREQRAHAPAAARAATLALLIAVIRAHTSHIDGMGQERTRVSAGTRAAMEFARSHLAERVSVTEMAHVAAKSVSRFHARFVRETGHTPAQWLRRERVLEAKRMLLTTRRSIVDVANDLGFPSSQYFATVFAQYTGLSPSVYRSRRETAGT
jgi:AraC-like DNA-binding protein